MAFAPSKKAKRFYQSDYKDPDLIPLMNIMLILIPILISIVSFIKYSKLEYRPNPEMAGAGGDAGGGGTTSELPELNLIINVVETGFQVMVKGGLPGSPNYWDIPNKPNGQYDFEGLRTRLISIRKTIVGEPTKTEPVMDPITRQNAYRLTYAYQDGHRVRISARSTVPWKVFTNIMDIIRVYPDSKLPNGQPQPLFTEPVFGIID